MMKRFVLANLLLVLFFTFSLSCFARIEMSGTVEGQNCFSRIYLLKDGFLVRWMDEIIICQGLSFHSELKSLDRPQDYLQVLCTYDEKEKETWRSPGFVPTEIKGDLQFPAGKLQVIAGTGYNLLDFKLYPKGYEENYHFRSSQIWTGNIVGVTSYNDKKYFTIKRDLDQKEVVYFAEAEGEIELLFADGDLYSFGFTNPVFFLKKAGEQEMRATRLGFLEFKRISFYRYTWKYPEIIRDDVLVKGGFIAAWGELRLVVSEDVVYKLKILRDQFVLFLLQNGQEIPVQIGNQVHCSWIAGGPAGWNDDGSDNPIRFICLENNQGASLPLLDY